MKLMYNCREMVDLVSQELDQNLPLSVRMRMAMHLSMCGHCRTYRDQIREVELMLEKHYAAECYGGEMSLSDDAKARIEAALNKEGENG